MARPKKNNAEYFSHDAGMRDGKRIKALRSKFHHEGYSIWNMLLEVLTHSEHFKKSISEIEYDLLAGDFQIEVVKLQEILDYCKKIQLLQSDDTHIWCEDLIERLQPMVEKRKAMREKYAETSVPESETSILDEEIIIPESETTQSKGEESKGKETEQKPTEKTEEKSVDVFGDLFSSWNPEEKEAFLLLWDEFKKMRKKKKKPIVSAASEKRIFKSLLAFGKSLKELSPILEQSIDNYWQGFFPLKTPDDANFAGGGGKKKTVSEETRSSELFRTIEKWCGEREWIDNPTNYTERIFMKYPADIIKRALREVNRCPKPCPSKLYSYAERQMNK